MFGSGANSGYPLQSTYFPNSQDVSFILSLRTAGVTGRCEGGRISMRRKNRGWGKDKEPVLSNRIFVCVCVCVCVCVWVGPQVMNHLVCRCVCMYVCVYIYMYIYTQVDSWLVDITAGDNCLGLCNKKKVVTKWGLFSMVMELWVFYSCRKRLPVNRALQTHCLTFSRLE